VLMVRWREIRGIPIVARDGRSYKRLRDEPGGRPSIGSVVAGVARNYTRRGERPARRCAETVRSRKQ